MFGLIQSVDILLIDVVQFLEFAELHDDLFVFSGVMLLPVFLSVAPLALSSNCGSVVSYSGMNVCLGKGSSGC